MATSTRHTAPLVDISLPATPPQPHAVGRELDETIHAEDGTPLAARFFEPRARARGAVLMAGAMGVPQSFYAPLATWLAEEGYLAVTFDYRGMGQSRRGSLREVDADIVTWAEQDTGAVLRALQTR